jgi:hypothetical protein
MRCVPWIGIALLILSTTGFSAAEPKLPDPPKGFSGKEVADQADVEDVQQRTTE